MDPYSELNVAKDATDDEIRRAYKRRAGEAHPDKGGTDDEFQRVGAAYRLLTDRTRRAHYDKTGHADGAFRDDRAIMLEEVAGYVLGVIDAPNIQLEFTDVVGRVRNILEREILELELRRSETHKKIAKRERAAKRFRRVKKGENLIAGMIRSECDRLRETCDGMQHAMTHKRELVAALLEYAFDVGEEHEAARRNAIAWKDLTA